MNISTKLRLLSMKNNLTGDVARIILDNIDDKDNITIARFMKDVVLNGCAYSNIRGLKYHNEMQSFYSKHEQEIQLMVFLYETNRNIQQRIEIVNDKNTTYGWWAFEQITTELMDKLHIR